MEWFSYDTHGYAWGLPHLRVLSASLSDWAICILPLTGVIPFQPFFLSPSSHTNVLSSFPLWLIHSEWGTCQTCHTIPVHTLEKGILWFFFLDICVKLCTMCFSWTISLSLHTTQWGRYVIILILETRKRSLQIVRWLVGYGQWQENLFSKLSCP